MVALNRSDDSILEDREAPVWRVVEPGLHVARLGEKPAGYVVETAGGKFVAFDRAGKPLSRHDSLRDARRSAVGRIRLRPSTF